MLRQPLKWHGGKGDLATKIIQLMPPRCINPNKPDHDDPGWLHYVEPYFGGGAVLLANDPEGISEVVNDLNGDLINFWKVLQDEDKFAKFVRRVQATLFSEPTYNDVVAVAAMAEIPPTDDWLRAWSFFIRCRQSLSGRMKGFTGITKTRTRGGMNGEVSAWLSCIDGLPAVHARLKRVLVLNRLALDVIKAHDGPRTLFYLDPPYLHETRATTGEYEHEMTDADHGELLDTLATIKGRFLLSGYHSDLYDKVATRHGWRIVEINCPNNAASGKEKRRMIECVWMNYHV
jgi:DNA adenine methylase